MGQCGESGGKGHFAGVGYGSENALLSALMMAYDNHAMSVNDFHHLIAHATGTRTNTKTEFATLKRSRDRAREYQGVRDPLRKLTVSAPKAVGDGHTMGETSLKAAAEAIQYVMGNTVCGIPTLKNIDTDVAQFLDEVSLSSDVIEGRPESGALVMTQGFGGYVGALAFRSMQPELLDKYFFENKEILENYKSECADIMVKNILREKTVRSQSESLIKLAEKHIWE